MITKIEFASKVCDPANYMHDKAHVLQTDVRTKSILSSALLPLHL